jgi:serine/threonine-protein kinase
MTLPTQIEFNRPAKYTVIEQLGEGACGRTVKIRDEDMNCDFVAKKYSPIVSPIDEPKLFDELLSRFRDEARILFQLNHPNIVRVFNYFDYREHQTSYIVMEYVAGTDIMTYLARNPANADKVFEGVIDGFSHLEKSQILHRDIRPQNILVDSDGVAKIIDFGFGKQITDTSTDDGKSISLNWWCETPPEFSDGRYDFQTEIYFIGKLFQKVIEDCDLTDFKYLSIVRQMIEGDRNKRPQDFNEIQRSVIEGKFSELSFSDDEVETYRYFASNFLNVISTLGADVALERDISKIIARLETLYRKTMLEVNIVCPNDLIRIFVSGSYKYWSKRQPPVSALRDFLQLLKGLSEEKKSIVIENLVVRLESIEKTTPDPDDDEVPF